MSPNDRDIERLDASQERVDPWSADATLEPVESGPVESGPVESGPASDGAALESTGDEATLEFSPELQSRLGAFAKQVPLAHPEQIRLHIPECDRCVQRMLLCEFVRLDLAAAIPRGIPRRIEDYVRGLPQLMPRDCVSLEMALQEQQLRRKAGEEVDVCEYIGRFPHLETALRGVAARRQKDAAPAEPASLAPGTRIDEFTILRPLGRGSFAQVYLARQETMMRLVALKVSKFVGDEPKALARFDHPNIVRVYDQRQIQNPPLVLLYIQFVPGGTLEPVIDLVRRTDPSARCGRLMLAAIDKALVNVGQTVPERSDLRQWLSEADWSCTVASIGSQLARALDYAHSRGILHRDIKPANVLLEADGVPKLADFNVSGGAAGAEDIGADSFGGSIAYMAPEHLAAADPDDPTAPEGLDVRADLYSLALMLWELWQGSRPWGDARTATGLADLIAAQRELRRTPIMPPTDDTATGRALGQVLARTLSHDRDRRPRTGAELAGQLKLALHPDAAPMFHPAAGSFRELLSRMPVWLVAALIILVPNVLAGWYNYDYNHHQVVRNRTEMRETLDRVALAVNAIAYPLGVTMLLLLTRSLGRGLRAARRRHAVASSCFDAAWRLGHRAAMIGAVLWTIAGVAYPLALKLAHPEFATQDAWHFFFSLVLCGGVAAVLPFFAGTAAGVLLYYPLLVAPRMNDPGFRQRTASIRKLGSRYLLIAAGVPLLAAALAVTLPKPDSLIVHQTLAASAIGIVVAFYAYRWFEDAFRRLAIVVSSADTQTVPVTGENA